MFMSMINLELILLKMLSVCLIFFSYGYLVISAPFLEEAISTASTFAPLPEKG